ncbi:hypothetical protein Tco_1125048 [Tanacetum coccineum]|uniref:Integrase, catalytic region, zinc finger, CCHC-type, peptidase aspartic, catalytic n=1 Tax=Tanacetum coccineum TaxID=301880 RepID=A0ABQ5J7Y9_9ASTR
MFFPNLLEISNSIGSIVVLVTAEEKNESIKRNLDWLICVFTHIINQLSQDFETRFVPQTKLSAEQAFWSQNSVNSPDPTLSSRPTKVEVPKELPKVSMVNTSLKKLKHHLAGFDVVVKERTTTTTITEGSWGFEHTKACFRDEIIPFVKALKDLFNTFDQYLIDELSEVQNVFHQMEQAVEQHRLESKTFEVKMNQVLNENERLLEQVINKDIVNIIMNSSVDNASVNVHECEKCLKLKTELLNKEDFVEKEIYDKLFKSFTTLEKHCISLEVDTQLNQEIFQRDNFVSNQRVKPSNSASGSQPSGNTKKDKIQQTPSSTPKNKHSKLNANSELLCVKCNGCMLSDNHDLCVLDFINDVNARNKSKSVMKSSKRKVFGKPIEKVFYNIRTLGDLPVTSNTVASTFHLPQTTVDPKDAPSPSNSQRTPETQFPIIPNNVEKDNHDLDVAQMNNDPLFGILIPENDSEASSSSDVIPTVV